MQIQACLYLIFNVILQQNLVICPVLVLCTFIIQTLSVLASKIMTKKHRIKLNETIYFEMLCDPVS